jgi:transcriptional regulator with XRE-family HTH domain
MMDTATKLRMLREEKGLSQEECAKALGIDRTTYAKYENGGSIRLKAQQIASFFGVSIDYLLGNAQTPKSKNNDTKEMADTISNSKALKGLFKIAIKAKPKDIKIATNLLEQLNNDDYA